MTRIGMNAPDPEVVNQQFRELFDSVIARLHAYLARQCDPSDVDDVAAEVMSEVYAKWERAPAGLENQTMWVFGFARNKLHELARQKRKGFSIIKAVSSSTPVSTELGGYVDEKDRVKRLFTQIPEKEREVIYLSVFSGFTSSEIAAILGISPTAVTTRAQRARQHLKKIIASEREVR